MKHWLLYFLAIIIAVMGVPLLAENSVAGEEMPKLSVFSNGEVKEMPVEEYTLRILIAQESACESIEAKKALAVAARSCGMYFSLYGCKHQEYEVCDDGNCCMYLGDPEDVDEEVLSTLISICEETKGQILTIDSLPCLALFTRCASKGTMQCDSLPYLSPVLEAERCMIHKTETETEIDSELAQILGNTTEHPPYLVFDESEKCELAILGGNIKSGIEIAKMLNLPTVEFTLSIEENKLNAVCYGIGHGYGLNICGAEKLAQGGMNYQNILEIYYPKLKMNKIYYN